ncbi:MAG: hypothetical protein JKY48_15245 [Flavobacteriales bacterium]|nr:hypothetical protein [Flavobacteriales bacterium]
MQRAALGKLEMADTFRFGQGPAPEVLTFFKNRKLVPAFNWQDVFGEEHAFAFTVAKATQIEVLSELHDAVQKAIKSGQPFEAFKKELAPRLKKLGWWGKQVLTDPETGEQIVAQLGSNRRLKIIHWANTRTAYGAGKWTRIQRTKRALPYLVYRLGSAREHRPHHVAKENVILPVDDDFWNSWYPPNGWGCVCWVRQITRMEAENLGGETERPEIPTKSWTNKRTGEVLDIPEGIDPGWQTNSGQQRHRTLAKHLAGKLDAAPEHIRKTAIADLVSSQIFRRVQTGVFGKQNVFTPVAIIPEGVTKTMGSSTRIAFLSTEDAAKQLRKRPAFSELDYIKAQQLLDRGEIFRETPLDFFVMGLIDGMAWRAVFHVTRKGDEIFLKSFRRTNASQMEMYRERSELIY